MPSQPLLGSRLPWPAPWHEIFGRAAPLLIEIGFGGGHFLLHLARQRPEANILGVEIAMPSLRRGQERVEKAGIGNVRLLYGDAQLMLWALCRSESAGGLYANFPDPWPKARHHHRRLINDRFLQLVATRLRPGALLTIATDHAEYAEHIGDCLMRSSYFDSVTSAPFVIEDRERIQTKYERQALVAGRTCHYFKWQRNEVPAPNVFPIPVELTMPHVVLRTSLHLEEIAQRFERQTWSEGSLHVKILDLYLRQDGGELLIGTYINEEPVDQRLGLTIRQREDGTVVLGLHEIGFPRPTAGVHLAIRKLAEWLFDLHPETKIISDNLQRTPE